MGMVVEGADREGKQEGHVCIHVIIDSKRTGWNFFANVLYAVRMSFEVDWRGRPITLHIHTYTYMYMNACRLHVCSE